MKDNDMDILNLIKNRRTIRKYKDISVSKNKIKKIIEGGRWASSVLGFQPWRFVVVTNYSIIKKISTIMIKKSKTNDLSIGISKLLSSTAKTIANSQCIILTYNQNIFKDVSYKFFKLKKGDKKIAELTELQSISAAIQNMILVADSLGIGSCWNTMPLFCEKEINKLLGNNEQLIAILTLGYPAEKGKRSQRKPIDKIVQYRF